VKTILPAYVWPGDTVEWARIWAHLNPDVIIANPGSGPGDGPTQAWTALIADAHRRGKKVVGYVHVAYGLRQWTGPAGNPGVLDDIAHWATWYDLDGFFADEFPGAPPAGQSLRDWLGSMQALRDILWGNQRDRMIFGNPGANPPTLASVALVVPPTVLCSFEGTAATYLAQRPKARFVRWRQCHLVYSAAGQEDAVRAAMTASGVGWGCVVPGDWNRPAP
jgi:hypothetical protein